MKENRPSRSKEAAEIDFDERKCSFKSSMQEVGDVTMEQQTLIQQMNLIMLSLSDS